MNDRIENPRVPEIATAFAIGVKPLDPDRWLEIGDDLPRYLDEKRRLEDLHGEKLFMAEQDTGAAQHEVLVLLAEYLARQHPDRYRTKGNTIEIAPAGAAIMLEAGVSPPLRRAARLVPDDLVIMRRGENGWRLVAASLCFPSSWSLADKFGKPLHLVHEPVPGFGESTRNAALIERMFDNLKPEMPVWRQNWSLYRDEELYHPKRQTEREARPDETDEQLFLRRERQTLRKLPLSGDILFTIGITVDPIQAVAAREGGPEALAAIAGQIAAMSADQLAYKGMADSQEQLLAHLRTCMRVRQNRPAIA